MKNLLRATLACTALFVLAAPLAMAGTEICPDYDCICIETVAGGSICIDSDFWSFPSGCGPGEGCTTDADCPFAGQVCAIQCGCTASPGTCVNPCASDCEPCVNPDSCGFNRCETPVTIDLASFTVTAEGGAVRVRWTTTSEPDNLGFRVLRVHETSPSVTSRGAGSVRLTPGDSLRVLTRQILPAEGDAFSGASYEFVDSTAKRPGTYYYYLEDQDFSGDVTLHGAEKVFIRPTPQVWHRR